MWRWYHVTSRCVTAFPLEEQGQDPVEAVVVTVVCSASSRFQELPFLNAPVLQEVRRHCSCLLGVSGERQRNFLKLMCLSKKAVNGTYKKKSALNPVSVQICYLHVVLTWGLIFKRCHQSQKPFEMELFQGRKVADL